MTLHEASFLCLIAFCLLGAFDGVYFHLIKYKLHLHPAARLEHQIHTARGFVFSGIGMILYAINSSGPLLLFACMLILTDVVLEIVDIYVEKEARRDLGGINPSESVLHVFASSFKFGSMILILLAKDPSYFSMTAPPVAEGSMPLYFRLFAYAFVAVTAIVSIYSLRKGKVFDQKKLPAHATRRKMTTRSA